MNDLVNPSSVVSFTDTAHAQRSHWFRFRQIILTTATFILDDIDGKSMKKPFIIGLAGAVLGVATACFVILTATSSDMTLSGVQVALFSSLGLGGAAISKKETGFAGLMLLSSAVWITLSVPVAGTFNLLYFYTPAILLLGIAAVLCFKEPEKIPFPENDEAE
ncbi:MAG: hypothetical protein Q7V05_01895 [Methanoregula sp.]|nr:hypothetical protein [Methanoregula sp.]